MSEERDEARLVTRLLAAMAGEEDVFIHRLLFEAAQTITDLMTQVAILQAELDDVGG